MCNAAGEHTQRLQLLRAPHVLLAAPLFGYVTEDEHDSDDLALGVADRRPAVFYYPLFSVAGHQHGVVGQADDHT